MEYLCYFLSLPAKKGMASLKADHTQYGFNNEKHSVFSNLN